MSNQLSPAQMKAMAQSLSDMGRRGDTQLVHVTPEEIELLKKIGAGTRNPQTGLLEFYHTSGHGVDTEESGWVEQWNNSVDDDDKITKPKPRPTNTGGSGSSSSTGNGGGQDNNPNDPNITGRGVLTEEERTQNRNNNWFDRDGDGSMWTSTDEFGHTTNFLGQRINVTSNNNSGYIWNAMDADGDGNFLTKTNPVDTTSLVGGGSTFSTVANVAALVANPIGYLGARAINHYFDKDGDGSMFTTGGKFTFGGGDGENSAAAKPITTSGGSSRSGGSSNSSNETEGSAEGADDVSTDEASTYSDVVGNFQYNENRFKRRADSRRFLEYDYKGGSADVTGSYTESTKPFQVVTSMEDAKAFAFSEQAANSIDQMVSMMPKEVSDNLEGSIHSYLTKDGNIAVIVGTDESGYVEATYAGSQDGAKNAMNDIANMLAYMEATGDTKVDAGMMGRIASAERFVGYDLDQLQSLMTSINKELEMYEPNSSSYVMALERKEEVEREIARRQGDSSTSQADYSEAGVANVIASAAKLLVNS